LEEWGEKMAKFAKVN